MKFGSILRHPIVFCLLIAHVVFGCIWLAREARALVALELAAYDMLLRLRPGQPADPRIALVELTEEDIQRHGYPIADGKLAQALRVLTALGAAAIGVDIYRDIPVPPGEEDLTGILQENPGIIWITRFGTRPEDTIRPPRVLVGTDRAGFNDLIDDGGTIRRGLLFLDDGTNFVSSFALRLTLRYLRPLELQPDPANPEHMRLGRTTVPPFEKNDGGYVRADARGYQFLLDFADMGSSYPRWTLSQAIANEVDPASIKDRIVIVGATAVSSKDYFYTPYSASTAEDPRMYGLELHAHISNQLLRFATGSQPPMRVLGDTLEYFCFWALALLAALITQSTVAAAWRFPAVGLLATAGLGGIAYVGLLNAYWLPLVPAVLAMLLTGALIEAYLSVHERRERSSLMQLFSKHVSKEIASSLWEQRDQFLEGGRPRPQQITATVLCTDIKGFTTISERLDPVTLISWLNEYMETMARQVSRHDGIVNKYIGDAIMGVFGVPVARTTEAELARDAVNAADCALSMVRWLRRLNRTYVARGLPPIAIRVGIHTGTLVAGSLGSRERMEYTVIGDTVNTAFRLESYDKSLATPDASRRPGRILISEETRRLLGDRFEVQNVGDTELKGKEEAVAAYLVIRRRRD